VRCSALPLFFPYWARARLEPRITRENRFAGSFHNPGISHWWQVLIVPAGTPSNVIDRLHKEVVKALAIAAIKERFPGIGLEAIGGDSKEAAAFVKAELDRWAKVIPAAGIHLD
jgi:tripartite-type tricarboxylate transporter receptor subunit TctC